MSLNAKFTKKALPLVDERSAKKTISLQNKKRQSSAVEPMIHRLGNALRCRLKWLHVHQTPRWSRFHAFCIVTESWTIVQNSRIFTGLTTKLACLYCIQSPKSSHFIFTKYEA